MGQKSLRSITTNYKNEVLWIMQDVLNKDISYISLNKSSILDYDKYDLFVNLIKRRKNKEPLQHILKSISFYGYDFKIKKNVFIPRPETELLVDIIKKNIGFMDSVLEVGTGSGCIPITMELEKLSNNIQTIDINNDAILLASLNAKNNNCTKIKFIHHNFFYFQPIQKYDLIVSNPPYIALDEMEILDQEVLLYDPLNALTDYDDGLNFYKYFFDFGINNLNENGYMLFEFGGHHQVNSLKNIFNNQYYSYNFFDDLNGDPRFILIQKL
tara:strand:- start:322 stop:1131 length:810 start_codon:yes stop_codon:yes gene_type:complete